MSRRPRLSRAERAAYLHQAGWTRIGGSWRHPDRVGVWTTSAAYRHQRARDRGLA